MSTKGEYRFDSTEGSPWMQPFVPRRFLRNGHLRTIVGLLLPRTDSLPEPESQLIEVEAATSARGASFVLCHCHWQPAAVQSERLTMVLVHGLEGSSSSPYVLGNSARAWTSGCNVVRMNMRSCGDGEQLSPSIYHAGRSEDVAIVMAELARTQLIRSFALVGYSMGGNLVLKLAGELAGAPPPYLKAVVGVSPLMDLVASSTALHEPQNRLYESRFLSDLLKRFRHKIELYPGHYSADGLNQIRTMRQFDEQIVSRYSGFADADDYYKGLRALTGCRTSPYPR
jgi:predicted alpha/beta-fold hydrolase